jgi:glycine cleavage system aminomethyltransferase T
MMWGGELIVCDGVPVGQLTSAAWGETVGAAVGLGYVRDPSGAPVTAGFIAAGRYQVNVGGQLVAARAGLRPPYDPSGSRVRCGSSRVRGG